LAFRPTIEGIAMAWLPRTFKVTIHRELTVTVSVDSDYSNDQVKDFLEVQKKSISWFDRGEALNFNHELHAVKPNGEQVQIGIGRIEKLTDAMPVEIKIEQVK
jgi:hypothetical protein